MSLPARDQDGKLAADTKAHCRRAESQSESGELDPDRRPTPAGSGQPKKLRAQKLNPQVKEKNNVHDVKLF